MRLNQFVSMLQECKIEVVVDVRSQPYSKYCPYFNKREIEAGLKAAGFDYYFKGNSLGGKPSDDDSYDEDGHVDYEKLSRTELFLEGINHLLDLARGKRLSLMCGEENPESCHRRLLLGPALKQRGIRLMHIRKNGVLEDDSEISSEEPSTTTTQLSLFETAKPTENKPWRSKNPVKKES